MISITALHRYPVKGLRGIDVESAIVGPRGFEYDREWMVVDANNNFVTQRNANLMATITTGLTDTHLVLIHSSQSPLYVPLDGIVGAPEKVVVWKDTCEAIDQGISAANWLSAVLAANDTGPVRLMRFAPQGVRAVEAKYLDGIDAQVGFADGYPYLVANEATLEALNRNLDVAVPMNRFRPNIVVNGLVALEEHSVKALHVPSRDVSMLTPKPCQRCKVTTIDQNTGSVAESHEPLRTLVRNNPFEHLVGGYFGQNGVAISGFGATLHVGDRIDIDLA